MREAIAVISIHFSKAKVFLYSQIWHAVLSQVSPTLIRIAHHTVTRCLGSTLEHTYHICTVVGVIIEGLTACMCIGRAFWQETDYFHRCGWLKTCFIIVDHDTQVVRIEELCLEHAKELWFFTSVVTCCTWRQTYIHPAFCSKCIDVLQVFIEICRAKMFRCKVMSTEFSSSGWVSRAVMYAQIDEYSQPLLALLCACRKTFSIRLLMKNWSTAA